MMQKFEEIGLYSSILLLIVLGKDIDSTNAPGLKVYLESCTLAPVFTPPWRRHPVQGICLFTNEAAEKD